MANTFLHIRSGEAAAARVVELASGVVRVGRGAQCEVCLEDPALDAVQCVIRKRGESWLIQPVGGPGRLWLAGKPVHAHTPWPEGASLRVGSHEIERRVEEAAQAGPGTFETPIELGPEPEAALAETQPQWKPFATPAAVPPEAPEAGARLQQNRPSDEQAKAREQSRARWREIIQKEQRWQARWRAAGARLRAQAQPPTVCPPAPPRPEPRDYPEVEQFRQAWDAPEPPQAPEPSAEPSPEPQLEPAPPPPEESSPPLIDLTILEQPVATPAPDAPLIEAPSVEPVPEPEPPQPEPEPAAGEPEPVVSELPAPPPAAAEPLPQDILKPDESRRPRGRFGGGSAQPTAPAPLGESTEPGPPRLGSSRSGPASRPAAPPWQGAPYGGFPMFGAGQGGYGTSADPHAAGHLGSGGAPVPFGWAQETPSNEWPSARAILEAHAARKAAEKSNQPAARKPAEPKRPRKAKAKAEPKSRSRPTPSPLESRPVLTFAQEPDHWTIPVGALWVAAVALTLAVGTGVMFLVGAWAADDYQAGLLANRLLRAELARADGKPEPIELPPDPDASWWRSTARHLWLWAFAHERAGADPEQKEAVGFFLDSARKASPIEPAVRFALAARAKDAKSPEALEQSLGLSRDVVALAMRSRRLLDAGKTDLGLLFAARALDMAARAKLAELDPASFDEQAEVRRYRLPYEDLMKPVLDDLSGRVDLPFLAWSKLLPSFAVGPLAAARALKEHNRAAEAAEAVRMAVYQAGKSPPVGASPAVHLAAGAEAMALAGRWAEAEKRYRQAVELMPLDTIKRSWWLNLADLYQRLGDDAKAREAWDWAKTRNLRDEITQRALAQQTQSGIGTATQTASTQPLPPPSPEPLIPTEELATDAEPTRVEPTAATLPPGPPPGEIPMLQGPAEPPAASVPQAERPPAPLPERPRIDVRVLRAGRPPGSS